MLKLKPGSLIIKSANVDQPKITDEQLKSYPQFYNKKLAQWSQIDFYSIEYMSNNHKVKGYILLPKYTKNSSCIIYNRGGSKNFGIIDEKKLFYNIAEFASMGYVVIASQYSGNDGSEGKDECGGGDVDDVIILKDVLASIENVNSDSIGMYGASRGGMMTYLAFAKVNWIKCAVIKAGSTNEIRGYNLRPELKEFRKDMYNVFSEEENIKRSAIFWPEKLSKSSPILLIHGTSDDKVSVLDTLEIAPKLYQNNVPFEMVVYKNDDHQLNINKQDVLVRTKNWFDTYLK